MQDLPARSSWIPGVVTGKCGPLSYTVALSNGCVVRITYAREIHCRKSGKTIMKMRTGNDNAPEDIPEAEETELPAHQSTWDSRQPDRFAPYINQLVTGKTT